MSGLFGLVRYDGRSPDRDLLEQARRELSFRGPDSTGVWSAPGVGMVHSLLRTTEAAARERQPACLDGRTCLVADIRLDSRETLVRGLRRRGAAVAINTPDPELILHAYAAWGEDLLDHLHGDFAFALWDEARRTLFCARDHFGVKPFFYADTGTCLLFSNTLACIRGHPGLPAVLNDNAIADMLLFGYFLDLDVTAFAQIHRLPPAHTLCLRHNRVLIRRYWQPDSRRSIRYRRNGDYLEHFRARFGEAVADRLPADAAVISMSGGLDSTAIAAGAKQARDRAGRPERLVALTAGYRRLFADPEGPLAKVAAGALGLPNRFFSGDGYGLFRSSDGQRTRHATPEPYETPFLALSLDFLSECALDARVMLHGKGGDELLLPECISRVAGLLPFGDIVQEVVRTLLLSRSRPPLCIRGPLLGLMGMGHRKTLDGLPSWLAGVGQPPWSSRALATSQQER